jgi:transposase
MIRRQLDEGQWSKVAAIFKQARRFATRYEKTLRNYTAVVALGCALLWLRI